MLDQRTRLRLAPRSRPELADQPVVVLVVALQRGFSPKYLERLKIVQKAVLKADCGKPAFCQRLRNNLAGLPTDPLDIRPVSTTRPSIRLRNVSFAGVSRLSNTASCSFRSW